jgi:hypothetical protein
MEQQRSYGSYDSQIPMKVFAGQPKPVTQEQVEVLQQQIDAMRDPCNRCPASKEVCDNMPSDNVHKQHCLEMLAQCELHCRSNASQQ